MAIRLTCPDCDQSFRAHDVDEGDEVRCPGCRSAFEVPADEAAPRRRRRKKAAGSSDWIIYAAVGGVLAMTLVVTLVLTLARDRDPANGPIDGNAPGGNALGGGITPGGNTPARPLGTGGGTQKVPADGVARIRLHAGGSRFLFGGAGDDGHVGALLTIHKPGGFEKSTERLDVYRVRTGEKVASIPIQEPLTREAALSPGGKYVAGGVPFKANLIRVIAADGTEVGRLSPATIGADGRPDWKTEVHWFTFLADDRLMTVTQSGGYDIWAVPGLKRVGGRPGLNLRGEDALFNMSDNYPNVGALTADNRTIALFNWSGVSLVDVATGTEKMRTEDFVEKDRKPQIVRVALSPDAKRVICLVIPSEGHADKCRLLQYDAGSGKLLKEDWFPRDPATRVGEPGMYMWGPNHLVIGQPGFTSRSVIHLPTGAILNPVEVVVAAPGHVSRIDAPSHAGRLWYIGSGGGPDDPGYLFGLLPSALPSAPNDKRQWAITVRLGTDG